MKPLTVAAALRRGDHAGDPVRHQSRLDPNGKYRTTDTHNYGVLDTTGIIRKSSNVGASLVAPPERSAVQRFHASLRIRQPTHSGFPGEAGRPVPTPDRWSGTTKQTMSYGYGLQRDPVADRHRLRRAGQRRLAAPAQFS